VAGRLLLLTLVSGFAFNGIESIFGFWGQRSFGWGPREIGMVFGVVGVTNAIAQWFVTGRLSRRWGQARALAAGMALTVVATLLIPLSRGMVTTTLAMSLMAFGQSVAFPNVGALISRVAHQDRQGQALGLNNATGAMARFLGPLVSGIVFSAFTIEGPFYLAAAVVAPAILLALGAGKALKTARVL
jgi:MFS family permease